MAAVDPDPSPRAFLLTYNPAYWTWPQVTRTKAAKDIAMGKPVLDSWNTGSRRSGVQEGDHVFVLQQGKDKRGLIAQGNATSTIYQGPHWDGILGHLGNYIDVVWTVVALSPYADIADLKLAVHGVNWSPRQSGLQVPPHAVPALLDFSAHMSQQN